MSIYLFVLGGCQLQAHPDDASVIQMTLWYEVNPPANSDVLQELVAQFNREHPDMRVESLYVGQADQ